MINTYMVTATIIQIPSSVTVVPGQNTTFSATVSTAFTPTSYAYQWRQNGTPIAGATNSSYLIDPVIGDSGNTFTVLVSALSGNSPFTATSNTLTLSVVDDVSIFSKFAIYPESGEERFKRLRNLGYV